MRYGKIICDPTSEEALNLVGKKVKFAYNYFSLMDIPYGDKSCLGVLFSVDETACEPFEVVDGSIVHHTMFIREVIEEPKKYVPYDLSKPEVRDKLRGRWYRETTDGYEACITHFYHADDKGEWHAEVYTAEELLRDCVWSDGTPCGEEVTE